MQHRYIFFTLIFLNVFIVARAQNTESTNAPETSKPEKKLNLFSRSDSTEIPKNLYLWGTILEKDLPLSGAQAIVYRDGIKRDMVKSDAQGIFDVYLEFGYDYEIEFAKNGYVSKRIWVESSNMPMSDRAYGYETGDFKVELFKSVKDVDFSIYKKPIGKIFYSPNNQQFIYDRRYIAKMKKETQPVEELVAIKLEELQQDQQYLRERFDILVRDGNIEFEAGDYNLAKTYFTEANSIFPNETYPQEMLAKINALQNKETDNELALLQRFMAKADTSFQQQDFENAILGYNSVLKIDAENRYAKKQIEVAKSQLKNQVVQETSNPPVEAQKIDISSIEINTNYIEKSREIAQKYPQGVTREEFKQGNKIIYLIYVVEGNKGVEYKKVKHDWGGEYYFRNELSIPKFQYNKETLANN